MGTDRSSNGRAAADRVASQPAAFRGSLADQPTPHNAEAERSMLGSCLLDNRMIDECVFLVQPSDFFSAHLAEVWMEMLFIWERHRPVDAVTLAEHLTAKGRFQVLGGDDLLVEIINSVPHSANASYYAGIVREKAISRQLIEAATDILKDCYSLDHESSDLICRAEERIFAISERTMGNDVVDMPTLVDEGIARIESRAAGSLPGLVTGYLDLDAILGGLAHGSICYVGARTSIGKTSLALGIASNIAKAGGKVLFFSMEMSRSSICDRLFAMHGPIDGTKIQQARFLTDEEYRRVGDTAGRIAVMPIWLDDSPSRSLIQLAAVSRRCKRRYGLDLVMVDYLQLIEERSSSNRENRQEEVARISRRLKALARELHLPLVCMVQLNRQLEMRSDKVPKLSDIRESGALENDADVVLLIHRPCKHDAADRPGEADIVVAKNRNGPTGTVTLAFSEQYQRFDTLSRAVHIPDDREPF